MVAAATTGAVTAGLLGLSKNIKELLDGWGIHTPWAVGGFIAGVGLVIHLARRWQGATGWRLLLDDPVKADEVELHALGIKRALRVESKSRWGERKPMYVPRDVDGKLRAALDRHQAVQVIGPKLAGTSRTAAEGVIDRQKRVLLPTEEFKRQGLCSLAALNLPLRMMLRRTVLWLDDLPAQIGTTALEPRDLRDFLRRHPRLKLVATISTDSANEAPAPPPWVQRLLAEFCEVELEGEFKGEELRDALAMYPGESEWSLRRLPVYFTAYHEVGRRFRAGTPAGRALVRAAAYWRFCGMATEPRTDFLNARALVAEPRTSGEDLRRAWSWACAGATPGIQLLEEIDGVVVIDELALAYVYEDDLDIPDDYWHAVLNELDQGSPHLLDVGLAAALHGRDPLLAWRRAELCEDDVTSPRARQLIDAWELEQQKEDGSALPEVFERAAEQGATGTLRGPGPEAATSDEAAGLFDLSEPEVISSQQVRFYRMRWVRFLIRSLVLGLLDGASLIAGLAIAFLAKAAISNDRLGEVFSSRWQVVIFTLLAGWSLLAVAGAYRSDSRRARFDRIALAFTCAALLAAGLGIAHGEGLVYGTSAWLSFLPAGAISLALRRWYDHHSREWVKTKGLHTRVLLVGKWRDVQEAARRYHQTVERPIIFKGYVSDDSEPKRPELHGTTEQLRPILQKFLINHVVIARPGISATDCLDILDRCEAGGATADLVLTEAAMQVHSRRVPPGGTLPLRRLRPLSLRPGEAFAKRSFDLLLGVPLLVLTSPLQAAVAWRIRRDGRGPAIPSNQWRKGYLMGSLELRRFRPRVGAGDFLACSGIDELPQLWSVVRGEMALVGPRPLPDSHVDQFGDRERRRYLVKPGLFSPWINIREPVRHTVSELVRVELIYLRSWSVWRDLEIVMRVPGSAWRRALRRSPRQPRL